MENLNGKCVILGITGGIAAYKMANVASALRKTGAEVHVIMTKNATEFITPLTFETLTGNKCIIDTFDRQFDFDVKHVSLAKKADLILIAPATANIIAKMANGICDDMLTTTVLAAKCKKLVSPAMNTAMLENQITQDNIAKLKSYGFEIIEPDSGMLACQDVGAGKMPSPETLMEYIYKEIAFEKDMAGMHITVTAGPTQEALDPVRYITNHSSGKMGYSVARAAMLRGADVTLISGQVALEPVPFVKTVKVTTAADMFEAVKAALPETDILVKSAAVADYKPAIVRDNKMKKTDNGSDLNLQLERTQDILGWVKDNKRADQTICGFSMETTNLIENSRSKLERKGLDMIVANSLRVAGAGFGGNTNVVTLITKDDIDELDIMSKDEVAHNIFNRLLDMRKKAGSL